MLSTSTYIKDGDIYMCVCVKRIEKKKKKRIEPIQSVTPYVTTLILERTKVVTHDSLSNIYIEYDLQATPR